MDLSVPAASDQLMRYMLEDYTPEWGLGTMSISIYDTAWVACVTKAAGGVKQWLFPASFSFILHAQSPNGLWPAHSGSSSVDGPEDSILTTLAAIHCLQLHSRDPLQLTRWAKRSELQNKIDRAFSALSRLLENWHVCQCKAVGFEILTPALLELVDAGGSIITFPERSNLLRARNEKLAKMKPKMLYGKTAVSLLHSLEALHGMADFEFDRLSHHKMGGSLMASPSSTAVYLMNCSAWDDEAEAYLRLVISNGDGKGSGAVPSAYPSTNFEMVWVASTLLEAGVWNPDTHSGVKDILISILEDSRRCSKGLVGFAPGISPDMDDSAKTSIIYSFLGLPGISQTIVDSYDSARCLKTYDMERDPSFSANCNALIALMLDNNQFEQKTNTIEKVVRFLCGSWFRRSGVLEDKWNLSPYYSAMLMAEAFKFWMNGRSDGEISASEEQPLENEVLLVTFQCLFQTLQQQNLDGSWGHIDAIEETCYAILTLASLQTTPFAHYFQPQIMSAIGRGRSYVNSPSSTRGYVWVEKVTYQSLYVHSAYVEAAMNVCFKKPKFGKKLLESSKIPSLATFAASLDGSPSFREPRWSMLASWIESELYKRTMRQTRHNGLICRLFKAGDQSLECEAFQYVLAKNTVSTNSSRWLATKFLSSLVTEHMNNCLAQSIDPLTQYTPSKLSQMLALTKTQEHNSPTHSTPSKSDHSTEQLDSVNFNGFTKENNSNPGPNACKDHRAEHYGTDISKSGPTIFDLITPLTHLTENLERNCCCDSSTASELDAVILQAGAGFSRQNEGL